MSTTYRRLSPAGRSAIIVAEIRGPRSAEILGRSTRLPAAELERRARHATFHDANGEAIDDGMILPLGGGAAGDGASFLVTLHGNPLCLERLFCEFEAAGALPGAREPAPFEEFVPSAGTIAREAMSLLPTARTPAAARFYLEQATVGLGAWADAACERFAARGTLPGRAEIEALLRRAAGGRGLAEPATVVLAGAPNAGKSTLFNALLGARRVVTDAEPGTTRDAISEEALFGDFPILLVDGAGLRPTQDAIEAEGVARMLDSLRRADLVLWLRPRALVGSKDEAEARALLGRVQSRTLEVESRADEAPDSAAELRISALRGVGLDELERAVLERLYGCNEAPRGVPAPFTERQERLLAELSEELQAGAHGTSGDKGTLLAELAGGAINTRS